jgi:hypothetical protein
VSKFITLEKTIFKFDVSNEERYRIIQLSDVMICPFSAERLRMPYLKLAEDI